MNAFHSCVWSVLTSVVAFAPSHQLKVTDKLDANVWRWRRILGPVRWGVCCSSCWTLWCVSRLTMAMTTTCTWSRGYVPLFGSISVKWQHPFCWAGIDETRLWSRPTHFWGDLSGEEKRRAIRVKQRMEWGKGIELFFFGWHWLSILLHQLNEMRALLLLHAQLSTLLLQRAGDWRPQRSKGSVLLPPDSLNQRRVPQSSPLGARPSLSRPTRGRGESLRLTELLNDSEERRVTTALI